MPNTRSGGISVTLYGRATSHSAYKPDDVGILMSAYSSVKGVGNAPHDNIPSLMWELCGASGLSPKVVYFIP